MSAPPVSGDPQALLLADLIAAMIRDTPSVQHVLDLAGPHLRAAGGLSAATVYALDAETGLLTSCAQLGEPGGHDLLTAGKVFRMAAGAPPLSDGERLAVRLRIGGQTVGVLLLTGTDLHLLRPDAIAPIALHFSTTLQALAAERQRQFVAHVSTTIRRLFEQGMAATSVEAAGRILTRSSAEAFRTEYAALILVDGGGIIRYVHSVGVPDGEERLHPLVGQRADGSPVWLLVAGGRPALIGDVRTTQVREGGLIQSMGLRSCLALPLMSAIGTVGMILCGDASTTREWTAGDRGLAEQLSVEGTLIVDSAGMRQTAQAHVAELSHQAFHDSLTGLPNRSSLLDRAEQAVEIAGATGTRMALMMLDLDGFKQVNDTGGHHAGDQLLERVAQRLLAAVRHDDVVARLGGDEFAILLTRDPDAEAAMAVAERICARLRVPFQIDGKRVTIGGSVGVSLFPDDAIEFADLMRGADAAMYDVKRDSKDTGGGARRAIS